MSNEYVEHFKDEEDRKLKQDFLDYIISIENSLEQAEIYGSQGDVRMLEIVEGLQDIQQKVIHQAEFSNEPVPPEDYSVRVGHIVSAYFSKVIDTETERIRNGIKEEGLNGQWKTEIKNLIDKIDYFKEQYSELEIAPHIKALDEIDL